MTVITRYPTAFTDASDLPVLRRAFPVAGYDYRWLASEIVGADGDLIDDWYDPVGDAHLIGTGTARPTLDTTTENIVVFDGTNDILRATGLTAQRTVALVVRPQTASGTTEFMASSADTPTFRVSRAGTQVGATVGTGANATGATIGATWNVVILSIDAANTWISQGASTGAATRAVMAGTPQDMTFTSLKLGARDNEVDFGAVEIAEVITWPDFRPTTDDNLIRQALIDNHPDLF